LGFYPGHAFPLKFLAPEVVKICIGIIVSEKVRVVQKFYGPPASLAGEKISC